MKKVYPFHSNSSTSPSYQGNQHNQCHSKRFMLKSFNGLRLTELTLTAKFQEWRELKRNKIAKAYSVLQQQTSLQSNDKKMIKTSIPPLSNLAINFHQKKNEDNARKQPPESMSNIFPKKPNRIPPSNTKVGRISFRSRCHNKHSDLKQYLLNFSQ